MSRFFSSKYSNLEAYVPGEQPKDMKYIKLNTNESPFPPSQRALEAAREEAGRLQLYSDPECTELVKKASEVFGAPRECILMTNGSDEILNFAFMAFCDGTHPIVFPNITYGFYPVFAELNGIPYEEIPLKEDFSVDYKDYIGINKNIVIANPNAPTGIALPLWQIEEIVKSNPDNVVIIDEAYVDFGAESAVVLTEKYDNLLVTGTFSKSRSLAGARLGFGIANKSLICDLNTIKYSTNPYNINRMTMAVGCAALDDNEYYMSNCRTVMENREYTRTALEKMGFEVLPSLANFLFARHSKISGKELYVRLKERGILIRHFSKEIIKDFNRITIGTRDMMDKLLDTVSEIIKEK
ncbi:MAG: histidinol-phosphate transaminase [Clostridia bacterium]|nr:histidinol-phosphate transaminase [Clostridia bacterium]